MKYFMKKVHLTPDDYLIRINECYDGKRNHIDYFIEPYGPHQINEMSDTVYEDEDCVIGYHEHTTGVETFIVDGGIVLAADGQVRGELPLRIAGIMSDEKAEVIAERLSNLQTMAVEEFGVNPGLDSIMTLAFMALPVIPEIKLTDLGLFDVTEGRFISIS